MSKSPAFGWWTRDGKQKFKPSGSTGTTKVKAVSAGQRYETESYLVHPQALARYIDKHRERWRGTQFGNF